MFRYPIQYCRSVALLQLSQHYSANHNLSTWRKTNMSSGDSFLKSRPNPVIKKLDTPEFRAIFKPELETIIEVFKSHNHEIRLAGGPVR